MRRVALALVLAVTAPSVAIVGLSTSGTWPTSWPAQLEQLRPQSRTLTHSTATRYRIPFTDRAKFEAAWPHLLSLSTDGSPLTLTRGPAREFDAGVIISTPNTGELIVPGDKKTTIYGPGVGSALQVDELDIPEGSYLRVGPPWPDDIRDDSGALPEYVVADGLKWRATTLAEIRNNRKRHNVVRRSRTEIRLVVDGKVVDLNRLKLPTSVVDKRFEISVNNR